MILHEDARWDGMGWDAHDLGAGADIRQAWKWVQLSLGMGNWVCGQEM